MKSAEILAQEMFSLLNQLGAIRSENEEAIYLAKLKECFNEVQTHRFKSRICNRGFNQKFNESQKQEILETLDAIPVNHPF